MILPISSGFYIRVGKCVPDEGGHPECRPASVHCQRHGRVLAPECRVDQPDQMLRVAWAGNQNPLRNYLLAAVMSCAIQPHSLKLVPPQPDSLAKVSDTEGLSTQRQSSRWCYVTQQKGGSQLEGNGVRHTFGSRHPRRQVLDPGQSMNPGWIKGRWCEDKNLINRYKASNKNDCDSGVPSVDLTSTVGRPFRS